MSSSPSPSQTGSVGEKLKGAAQTAKEKIQQSTTQARESAADYVETRKEEAADRLSGVGESLHQAADTTRSEDPNVAWLTDQAATRLQQAAEYVRTCSWTRLRDDGATLARRHPLVFFGGMFLLGAVAGAVVKAGVEAAADDRGDEPYTPEDEAGGESSETVSSSSYAATF